MYFTVKCLNCGNEEPLNIELFYVEDRSHWEHDDDYTGPFPVGEFTYTCPQCKLKQDIGEE